MKVRELFEMLSRRPMDDILCVDIGEETSDMDITDVLVGHGINTGFCYLKLETVED